MQQRLTIGLGLLRALGIGAVVLLLVNPTRSRPVPASGPPLVLLDASLSMAGPAGPWRAALDSARRLAGSGPIWRFGSGVAAFDSGPPGDGVTRLAPALAAAAARGGAVVVLTDGAVADAAELPADLRRRPRIVVLPRAAFFDAYVASIDGPRRVAAGDTVRLRVAFGTAGKREGAIRKGAALSVNVDGRRLSTQTVTLPDSGVAVTDLTLPSSLLRPGLQALDVRLDGTSDSEPRDDARTFVIEVSPEPTAVVLAAPPDWESRFFARALAEVARVPVKLFVRTEPGRWRDAATLAPVATDAVSRAVAGARLVALIGDPVALAPFRRRSGLLTWPLGGNGRDGDWYVDPPPASPLAGALAGVAWDSLPPAASLSDVQADSSAIVPLTARLGRRGAPRPLVVVRDSAGSRTVVVAAAGLWRWGFRSGAPAEAYRTFVATVADWLLAERGAASAARFAPVTLETPDGLPLLWQWTGRGPPVPAGVRLESEGRSRTDTLRFDVSGRAELHLPPASYHWQATDGPERGLVVVERYSDEWRPAPVTLGPQAGEPGGSHRDVGARDQWWLYVLALAAFVAEWAWRRRQGLP